ncbi:hypothetical protein [Acinetobacter sp. Ver3]|uniref:hypothetical protein n=1 Tax=Acinetobacter sp. Ver3 TaxID=466088 RepID=UPI0012DB4932|nr:hypothetical protein [Acinetobacter sp. Ver3]
MKIRILVGAMVLCGLSYSYANGLTQSQFDIEVKSIYNEIEASQIRLHQSVDSKQNISLIIQRACEYADALYALERIAQKNIHMAKAKEEALFAKKMRNSFELSFQDLGTSYQKSCKP